MVFESTWMLLVANSTPMVDLESRLNSFLVNRLSRLDFPTPESPISTTISRWQSLAKTLFGQSAALEFNSRRILRGSAGDLRAVHGWLGTFE